MELSRTTKKGIEPRTAKTSESIMRSNRDVRKMPWKNVMRVLYNPKDNTIRNNFSRVMVTDARALFNVSIGSSADIMQLIPMGSSLVMLCNSLVRVLSNRKTRGCEVNCLLRELWLPKCTKWRTSRVGKTIQCKDLHMNQTWARKLKNGRKTLRGNASLSVVRNQTTDPMLGNDHLQHNAEHKNAHYV